MKLPSILKPKGLYTTVTGKKKNIGMIIVAAIVAIGAASFAIRTPVSIKIINSSNLF